MDKWPNTLASVWLYVFTVAILLSCTISSQNKGWSVQKLPILLVKWLTALTLY